MLGVVVVLCFCDKIVWYGRWYPLLRSTHTVVACFTSLASGARFFFLKNPVDPLVCFCCGVPYLRTVVYRGSQGCFSVFHRVRASACGRTAVVRQSRLVWTSGPFRRCSLVNYRRPSHKGTALKLCSYYKRVRRGHCPRTHTFVLADRGMYAAPSLHGQKSNNSLATVMSRLV